MPLPFPQVGIRTAEQMGKLGWTDTCCQLLAHLLSFVYAKSLVKRRMTNPEGTFG